MFWEAQPATEGLLMVLLLQVGPAFKLVGRNAPNRNAL
jgi:hypothetical protein